MSYYLVSIYKYITYSYRYIYEYVIHRGGVSTKDMEGSIHLDQIWESFSFILWIQNTEDIDKPWGLDGLSLIEGSSLAITLRVAIVELFYTIGTVSNSVNAK